MSYTQPLIKITITKPNPDAKERLLDSLYGYMPEEVREKYDKQLAERKKL